MTPDFLHIDFLRTGNPRQRDAYRHMIIEHSILDKQGAKFRTEVMDLKRKGWKTEPAFTKLLGLHGDHFVDLLKFEVESGNIGSMY